MVATVAPSLHIAYKEWAYEPRTFAHCRENLRATQRWANDLHCLGGEFADGNPGLHFPYLDEITTDLDGGRLEQDYLALERFANATCAGLHIPYKEWLRLNPDDTYGPRKEQANLLAVERWAAGVGRCCAPSIPSTLIYYNQPDIGTDLTGDIATNLPPADLVLGSAYFAGHYVVGWYVGADVSVAVSTTGTGGWTERLVAGAPPAWQLGINQQVLDGTLSAFVHTIATQEFWWTADLTTWSHFNAMPPAGGPFGLVGFNTATAPGAWVILVNYRDAGTPRAGTWVSGDSGVSWSWAQVDALVGYTDISFAGGSFISTAVNAPGLGPLVATSPDGVVWSFSAMPYPSGITPGLTLAGVASLVVPSTPSRYVRWLDTALVYSDDGGSTWAEGDVLPWAPGGVLTYSPLLGLAAVVVSGSILYTSADGLSWHAVGPTATGVDFAIGP